MVLLVLSSKVMNRINEYQREICPLERAEDAPLAAIAAYGSRRHGDATYIFIATARPRGERRERSASARRRREASSPIVDHRHHRGAILRRSARVVVRAGAELFL